MLRIVSSVTENVEKCCNHSGDLADFQPVAASIVSISSSGTHHPGPSELCRSFVTRLVIHEHTTLKALISPSNDPERRNCGSKGSSVSKSVIYWDIHIYPSLKNRIQWLDLFLFLSLPSALSLPSRPSSGARISPQVLYETMSLWVILLLTASGLFSPKPF